MKFDNFETLRSNFDFKCVYNRKKSFANRYLIMYISENGTDALRLGVSVSKKVGNSIVRHRLARLIREAFRLNADKVNRGYDIVVIARAGAMLHLLKLHHLTEDDCLRNGDENYGKKGND